MINMKYAYLTHFPVTTDLRHVNRLLFGDLLVIRPEWSGHRTKHHHAQREGRLKI